MLITKEATESLTLNVEVMAAKEVSLDARKHFCCIYDDNYCSRQEAHELKAGEDLTAIVDLLLCDPLYNVRHHEHLLSGVHDLFRAINMEAFCVFAQMAPKLGVHGHIFCSTIQIAS